MCSDRTLGWVQVDLSTWNFPLDVLLSSYVQKYVHLGMDSSGDSWRFEFEWGRPCSFQNQIFQIRGVSLGFGHNCFLERLTAWGLDHPRICFCFRNFQEVLDCPSTPRMAWSGRKQKVREFFSLFLIDSFCTSLICEEKVKRRLCMLLWPPAKMQT